MNDNKNPTKTPRHIYIDCSGTFYACFNTGIQRTVRNIVLRLKKIEEKYNIPVIPVIAIMGRFAEVNSDDLSRRFYKEKKTVFDRLSEHYLGTEKKINNKNNRSNINNKNTDKKFKLIIFANIRKQLKNIFQTAFFGYLFFVKRFKFKNVKINAGDLIFLPDTYWSFNVLSIANKYKTKKNAVIITLVYDIIPITYPQFFDSLRIDAIIIHINKMIDYSDGFICNSKYSADEFQNYLKKRQLFKQNMSFRRRRASLYNRQYLDGSSININILKDVDHKKKNEINNNGLNKKPIEYFYLGNDFGEKKDIYRLRIRSYIKNILRNKNVYLMVGTIEPRKNHLFVLNAFENLWGKGFNGNLIIVGVVGWNCDNILERFKNSKYLNKYLFVYNNINDAELKYLYKNSKALIIASIIEGFGFPLVEAAHYNLNIFASDIPVFREIGKDYPVYFSLNSEDDLMQKIISFGQTEQIGKVSEIKEKKENVKSTMTSLSWDDSIDSLSNKLIKIYNALN
ncbi:MAG: glycosyltransferase [bacterium]